MKVLLREIPCRREVQLTAEFVGGAIGDLPLRQALEGAADRPAGEARADLDLYEESENVFVRGNLRGWLEVACSRCVEAVKIDYNETLAISYVPNGHVPSDDDVEDLEELAAEDVDLYGYEGDVIDLQPLLHEKVVMAVPYAPLCRPDCQGLCAQCGVNLNEQPCSCEPVGDPRLAALKDFKV